MLQKKNNEQPLINDKIRIMSDHQSVRSDQSVTNEAVKCDNYVVIIDYIKIVKQLVGLSLFFT
jgi:hypothetical protein